MKLGLGNGVTVFRQIQLLAVSGCVSYCEWTSSTVWFWQK